MNYNWTTTHNTAKEQMTHTFENGVQVMVDYRLGMVYVSIHGDKTNTIPLEDVQDVEDYTKFLVNTAKQAEAIPSDIT